MIRQYELVEKVKSYDPQVDENLLNRAYVFSMKAHGAQVRASGDPYFSHPLEVAGILTDMNLDGATIATALLHDTVEDTIATAEEIEELFGLEIATLVEGVTKLGKLDIQTESARQAENFRKFLLALSDDIRVLLVKLADRLHNMRTLHHIKNPDKRRRIALETMEIYAPLAERIGVRSFKDELEDLSFKEVNPEAFDSVSQRLEYLRKKAGNLTKSINKPINKLLKIEGVKAIVEGREKTPFSIWNKMERLNVRFEQLSDVMAFRILVDNEEDCYKTLGLIHKTWAMVPGQFDDYISTPKRNGYKSIHTAVMGPDKFRIEIQIKTHEMHRIAESGVAAHWRYKTGGKKTEGQQYKWVQELLEILDHAVSPEEFLEHTKLEMFQDQVFCFTPKGTLISLPRGSTTVDFAYAVHTRIGDTCVGAKVNSRHVPLRHQLENGDQVEILRSKAQTPSPQWEGFVITGKARVSIRRFVRKQHQAEYIKLGKDMLQHAFRKEKLNFKQKVIKDALYKLKADKVQDVYEELGQGFRIDKEVLQVIFPSIEFLHDPKAPVAAVSDWDPEEGLHAIPIRGLTPGMAVHLSDCCHPLPGDRIVGEQTPGKGIMIHTIDCDSLRNIEDQSNWLDLSWRDKNKNLDFFAGRLKLVMLNEAGALGTICSVVARTGGNISNLKVVGRDPDFFTMLVDVEVKNVKHLTSIMATLRALDVISTANRMRG